MLFVVFDVLAYMQCAFCLCCLPVGVVFFVSAAGFTTVKMSVSVNVLVHLLSATYLKQ